MNYKITSWAAATAIGLLATGAFAADPVDLTRASLDAQEARLTSFEAMAAVKAAIATRSNDVVNAIAPGNPDNPSNVKRVEMLLGEQEWEYLFPRRAKEYTYRGMLQAVGKFPAFCGDYAGDSKREAKADDICRKSLATMFAHFAQETGEHDKNNAAIPEWRQALHWVREMGWDESKSNGYAGECNPSTWQGKTWPCGTMPDGGYKSYFGRGAKQLSYNYNYGPFSDAMFGDVRVLLDKPELVADTWLNLASAVFFFVYPQPPKPSMLHVIDGTWTPNQADENNGLVPGFGVTTQIINGGVECGGSQENQQSVNRIAYYEALTDHFKVDTTGEVLGCKGMKQFDERGRGALPIYWEQDWSWVAGNPNNGKSYKCQLVSYQTPYTAFKKGDYAKCVQAKFPEVRIDGKGNEGNEGNGGGGNPQLPKVTIDGPATAKAGSIVALTAKVAKGTGAQLRYEWQVPEGIAATDTQQATLQFTAPHVKGKQSFSFTLRVTDQKNKTQTVKHVLQVNGDADEGGNGGNGGNDGQCATQWQAKSYAGGSKVMNKGRIYVAKWWADGAQQPGDKDVTDTTGNGTDWGKVWEDKGACKR